MRTPDFLYKHLKPMRAKSLRKQLSRTIRQHFPHIGGPRMTDLCADIILEVVDRHLLARDSLHHGQLVWLGFDINDPPARNKTSENVRLIPVVLDLWTDQDLEAELDRVAPSERLLRRCIRLHEQAHAQGALLSTVDLSAMLAVQQSTISRLLAAHERDHHVVIPRRATLHDVGSGVTHKRIICRKRYVDGKSPEVIARETHHSLTSVDHYLGAFDRVRCCHQQKMPSHEIARILGCTERLVKEYLVIDQEIERGEA
jgi:Protein of unknown function (DUF1670)